MAREKKIELGAINVTTQPHTPEMYLQLFKDAFNLKRAIHLRGDQWAILTAPNRLSSDQVEPGPVTGDIYRFTNIESNGQWFNIETNEFAADSDVKGIRIPEHLKPNSSRFSYIFYPKEHIFFYESYYDQATLAPSIAESFLEGLLRHESLATKYGRVEVTHEPTQEIVDKIINLAIKYQIDFEVSPPNADTLKEAESRMMERLNSINAERMTQSYKAPKGESIVMDGELTTLANVSARNGNVAVRGKDSEHRAVTLRTKDHPWIVKHYYKPDQQLTFEVFTHLSQQMLSAIRDKISKK